MIGFMKIIVRPATTSVLHKLLAVSALVLLSACANTPDIVLDLPAPPTFNTKSFKSLSTVKLFEADSSELVDTNIIVVRRADSSLTAFPNAQWAGSAQNMFRLYMSDAIAKNGLSRYVYWNNDLALTRYRLSYSLRNFLINERTQQAEVDLYLRLIDNTSNLIKSTMWIKETYAIKDFTPFQARYALSQALEQTSAKMLLWLVNELGKR